MLVEGGTRFRCNKCGATKDATAEHFYFDRQGRVTGYCRPCQRAYNRTYYRDTARSVRERWRVRTGDAPRCHAWPALVAVLGQPGGASVAMVAQAVYGDASDANRRAAAMMLCDLARPGQPYGGPWVARIRWGWYALGGVRDRAYPSKAAVARALRRRPRTVDDLVLLTGCCRKTVERWLTALRRDGVPIAREVVKHEVGASWHARYRIEAAS